MGVSDFFFGKDSDVEHDRLDTWNKGQKRIFGDLEALLGSGDLLQGNQGGPFGASLTSLEDWAKNVYGGGVTEGGQQSQQSLVDLMQMGPQNIDDYFSQTVEKPMMESFQENVRPGINRQYAPSGFWSSQRGEADQRASEELIDTLGRERSRMAFGARESDLNRVLGAAGVAGQQEMGARDDLMGLSQMGIQMQQFQTQAMLNALGLRSFENVSTVSPGQTGLFPGMIQSMADPAGSSFGTYAGAAAGQSMFGSGAGGSTGNWSGVNDPGSYGQQGGQLQGQDMMSMLPMLMSMFGAACDRRLKKNIHLVDDFNGIPMYEFEYIWSPVKHIGPMAQDLLHIRPEAVFKFPSGYYGVNLLKLI
jgi:hypothetical protein